MFDRDLAESPTALPFPLPMTPVPVTSDRSPPDSPARVRTYARRSSHLATASSLGFACRCLLARPAALLASSLDFLQGTSEKIRLQGLFRQDPLQMVHLFAQRGGACVLPGGFHPGISGSGSSRHR